MDHLRTFGRRVHSYIQALNQQRIRESKEAQRVLSERHLVYTVRFLIGHDILALVLFLSRRDRRKEQRMQRREEGGGGGGEGGRRKALRTRDNGRATTTRGPAAVVSAGGIGRGAQRPPRRVSLSSPRAVPPNHGLDS